jgi:hypothetical protein
MPTQNVPKFAHLRTTSIFTAILCGLLNAATTAAQETSFGNGLSAAAEARGGTVASQQGGPLDAVEGNPAGLAGISAPVLEVGAVGVLGSGSFQKSFNSNGRSSRRGAVRRLHLAARLQPLDGFGCIYSRTPDACKLALRRCARDSGCHLRSTHDSFDARHSSARKYSNTAGLALVA